jgi:hypothetical protein
MTEYDAATFRADGKHLIAKLAAVMPVLMIATGVLGLVVVIVLFRHGAIAAAWLALAGLLALVAVIAVTLAVEVPSTTESRRGRPRPCPRTAGTSGPGGRISTHCARSCHWLVSAPPSRPRSLPDRGHPPCTDDAAPAGAVMPQSAQRDFRHDDSCGPMMLTP